MQMSTSSGTSASAALRAWSNRQGLIEMECGSTPRRRKAAIVPSVEPVSAITTRSASAIESMNRSTNFASLRQIA